MNRFYSFALWALLLTTSAVNLAQATPFAGKYQELPLWGDTPAPGTKDIQLEEQWDDFNKNPNNPDYSVANISRPSLTVFPPANPNGSAMVVIPGGGYRKNVFDKEGVDIAHWLNSLGITAFVLKYRLPVEWPDGGRHMAFQDGQRAMRLIRAQANTWKLDKDRIGVMGFSAGGHLAASLGSLWEKQSYSPIDKTDKESARPDAMIIVYGVVDANINSVATTTNEAAAAFKEYKPIKSLSKNSSPAFIVTANDDSVVNPAQSARFYLAMQEQGVVSELHIFRDGGHGFAIRKTNNLPVADWTRLCEAWMMEQGFLRKKQ
jgi:acetyl esterase/lipase